MNKKIEIINLRFGYRSDKPVLCDINLVVEPGHFIGIVGPNGSGKTTLARMFNGNLLPTSGSVLVDGFCTSAFENARIIKQKVSLIHSDSENQFIMPTVFDEMYFSLRLVEPDTSNLKNLADEILEKFSLSKLQLVHPFFLSMGEQFRLLTAIALVRKPRYLIFDEAFSSMDGASRDEILSLTLDGCSHAGLGMVLFTHRLDDLAHADQIIVLQEGSTVATAAPLELLSRTSESKAWNIEPPLLYEIFQGLNPDERFRFSTLFNQAPFIAPE